MREKIEAFPQEYVERTEYNHLWCYSEEVRELESDYAKLEARLGEAEKVLKDIQEFIGEQVRVSPFTIYSVISDYFATLDQEKEKSDER